tara:strand:+ start:951 stop:1493 length:543 start_codon:yes stop_codon:yes gene_type:complete
MDTSTGVTTTRLGPCSVVWDSDGTPVDLGVTKGGVEVTTRDDNREITCDQYGDSPIAGRLAGTRIEAKVVLMEWSYVTMNEILMSGHRIPAAPAAQTGITFGQTFGDKHESYAKEVTLHPQEQAAADLSEDVILYKAFPRIDTAVPYSLDGERVVEVTFVGLIDDTRNEGDQLWRIGELS